ncbi:antitoxin [Kribbella albertanoniae]|uniref:antitoxin n=1 Tax=Kribbella albertanoniae TaxID=1266829 RepID=UPI003B833595
MVDGHGDKVAAGLDKAGDFVDEKTAGKYGDKIDQGVDAAKDQLDNLDGQNDDITDDQR